jgi:hypothetical protein
MLAYDLNNILQIVPEAVGMVKEASLSEEFPVDSRDSALASGLQISYLTKVAGESVDYATQERVSRAVLAYGLSGELEKLASRIEAFGMAEKQASLYNAQESLQLQEEVLRGSLGFHQDLIKVASYAEDITARFNGQAFGYETSLYSAGLPFGESEVSNALQKRAYETGDTRYNDILTVVTEFGVESLNLGGQEKRASVAKAVVSLDQEHFYNGDFYKEAFVKEASYNINLGSKTVPFEKIARLGSAHIGDILGKDVADALTGDYGNDKAVLESLPLDEKNALGRFV